MKTCPDCGQAKDLEDFPPARKRSDGRSTYCKECMKLRSTASYRKRMAEQGKTVRDRRIAPSGKRWCPDCESFKPTDDFPLNRASKTGFATYCKPCHNLRTRKNVTKNHGSTREFHLRRRYGIGQAEVDQMLTQQHGKCVGCGKPDPGHVDHDHSTDEVRGMLCFNCNQALGNVRDNINVMYRLIAYLMKPTTAAAPPSCVDLRFVERLAEVDAEVWIHRAS
jgi:hypothetical protein